MTLILARLLVLSFAFCAAQATSLEEHLSAGNELLRAGRYQDAEKLFWDTLKAPDLSDAQRLRLVANLNSVALAHGSAGRYSEAEALYRRVLTLGPRSSYHRTSTKPRS